MNYRITLAYDGTNYCGWQLQLGLPTIQLAVQTALEKLEGRPVISHAAGRTDTGVHAEGQVVSFRLSKEWNGRALRNALNGNLPRDIRVMDASVAAEDFHARFDAQGKVYRYRVFMGEVMNPLWARYAWHYPYPLELGRLTEDARALIGTYDFTAFTVASCATRTHVRTITSIRLEQEGGLLTLFFHGDGFLRYQVRTMVGALAELSRGRLAVSSIGELIARRDRNLIGASAPAQGLTLLKVEY